MNRLKFFAKMATLWTDGRWLPQNTRELLNNTAFERVVKHFVSGYRFSPDSGPLSDYKFVLNLLRQLAENNINQVLPELMPEKELNSETIWEMHQFVEELYNFWRCFERFLVVVDCESGDHKAFKDTATHMNHLVRKAYRDICENITQERPRVYRQVAAGFQAAIIARRIDERYPESYGPVHEIPVIRQILLSPPLIIDPPVNKRTGEFLKVNRNPLECSTYNPAEFLCYPARVGDLLINIYFHSRFMNLGCSLCNLFELAGDEDAGRKPDAVYFFGLPARAFNGFSEKTVFFEDSHHNMLVGAAPATDNFGYFGYLKKMVLTLHNVIMMKRGRMPIHGAMFKIDFIGRPPANILVIGDTGAGKSETIEAFRVLGNASIRKLTVIFDDMGSLDIKDGRVLAYGTEVGAFVRLDDLSPGYAYGNIDRSIFMSPNKVNARVVLPVTSMQEVLRGHLVDMVLYANNYEEEDHEHPVLERFESVDNAWRVFREGTSMSKGTTTSTGIVHSYFANIFGPTQYIELHDEISQRFFAALFKNGSFIGQLRTRLGIDGYQNKGPLAAAEALLETILKKN
ncbi:MAG: phosphoenolpyruvate carboxykinase [Candidatus Riflebacteria bacterium]|nr:phosphoenolpyruvate carboxykinase [Candidatus Riflebacteria bacterium]